MHDLVVRDLEQARNLALGLTDLDDLTLLTQHDLLTSPLVWDLAHAGQQEERWTRHACWRMPRTSVRARRRSGKSGTLERTERRKWALRFSRGRSHTVRWSAWSQSPPP
jgi:hypothetical protein